MHNTLFTLPSTKVKIYCISSPGSQHAVEGYDTCKNDSGK